MLAARMATLRKLLIAFLLLTIAVPSLAAGADTLTTDQKFEVLKAKGIFTGLGDGSAGLNQSMTREQFAAVLFRLWGLTDTSPAKSSFDDVLKTRWSYREVEAVNKAKLMNGIGDRQFAPAAKVTVEQLAAVLVRAYGYTGAGTSKVTGKASLWARGAIALALDHKFIAAQTDYTVAATRGLLVEAAYAAYQQLNAEKLQVNTVQPVANSLIQVTLKQAVSKVDASSFSLKDDQGTVIAIRSATLSADGKVITVSTGPQQGEVIYTLTIDGTGWRYSALWAGNGGGTTNPGDTSRPTVQSLENLGDRRLRIIFSEQVIRSTAEDSDHYDITEGRLVLYDYSLSDDRRTLIVTTGAQEDGYRYRLAISGVQDLAGNTMTARGDLYFYGIDDDRSKPSVVSVTGQNDSTVKLVFSERVDADDAKNTRNYSIDNGLRVNRATLASDGKTVTLSTSEPKNGQEYKITVKGIADLSGNVMNTQKDIAFRGVNDHDKPIVLSVDVLGDSTVEVKFSEKINADQAKNTGYYSVDNGLWVTNAVLSGSGDTVILTTSRQTDAVLYTLTIQGIADLAGNTMDKAGNLYFGGLVDRDAPSIVGIQNTARQVILTFSERLDYGTAANAGNYRFEGNLGAVKGAAYDDGRKTVTLTTETQTPGSVYAVIIGQVKDLSGNPVQETRIQFVGSDRETAGSIALQRLEVVNQNTVQAVFSRALYDSNVDSLDLTILKDNNRDVDVRDWSEYVVRKPGTDNTVLIQLRTKASGNPSLFVPGHVYIGRITDLDGLATEDGANQKVFPGTEKKNEAPYAASVVALNDTAIKVTFSEPVRGVEASGFVLLREDNTPIKIAGDSVNDKNRIVTEVTLYLDGELKSGNTYRLRFQDSVKDAAGWNSIRTADGSNPYQVVFAGTSTDNDAPRVTKVVSKDRLTFEIEVSEPIRIEDAKGFRLFSASSGDEIRIQPNDYAIYALNGDRRAISVHLNADRLDPMKKDERYRLEYDSSAGRITDDQGAWLQSSDNGGAFLFTASGADNSRPFIAKVDARGTTIAITFSESIRGYSNQTDFFRIDVNGQEVKPSEGALQGQTIVLKVPSLASGKIGKLEYTDAGASQIKDYNQLSPDRDAKFTFGIQ